MRLRRCVGELLVGPALQDGALMSLTRVADPGRSMKMSAASVCTAIWGSVAKGTHQRKNRHGQLWIHGCVYAKGEVCPGVSADLLFEMAVSALAIPSVWPCK